MTNLGKRIGAAVFLLMLASAGASAACDPATRRPFTGLYPAIEGRLPLTNFAAGMIVEIDPRTMPEDAARDHIAELQALGARVSIYLVGGHCDLGQDCDSLTPEVRLGTTGSWNWDRSERRILDITHEKVLQRLARGIANGWRLGANYIRIDNLHFPAGSSEPRTPKQMRRIIDVAHDIEDLMRKDGDIPPERHTGLVAHNNLLVWLELLERKRIRRPPVFMTSERTGQLAPAKAYEGDARLKAGTLRPADVPEIAAGAKLALKLDAPYAIKEFQASHDLGGSKGQTYQLPQGYVDQLVKVQGVTEVGVIPRESQYVGTGKVYKGSGPDRLPGTGCPGRK
jgi:hypothetical protein